MISTKRFWIGLAISVLLLALFLVTVDLAGMVDSLAKADYLFLVPGIALYLVAVFFRSLRWQVMLRHLRPIKVGRLFPVVVVGYMANNLLPMRLGELVRSYFPPSLPDELRDLADDHPLFRRIAALMQSARIVDEGGATAASYLVRAADRSAEVAADAWFLMDEVLGGEEIRHGLGVMEEPEPGRIAVPPAALYTTRGMVADGVTEAGLWLLRVFAGARFKHLMRRSDRFIKLCKGYLEGILDHLSDPLLTQAWELQGSLVNLGAPKAVASRAAAARFLPSVISLAELSRREGKRIAPANLVALYLEVARQTRLLDIYFSLSNDVRDDEWEDRAVRTVKTHFLGFLDRLTHAMPALMGVSRGKSPDPRAVAEILNDRLKMAPLLEEVDEALRTGTGLGQIVVFSEAYRRRVHQADAYLETSRRGGSGKGEGGAKRKSKK